MNDFAWIFYLIGAVTFIVILRMTIPLAWQGIVAHTTFKETIADSRAQRSALFNSQELEALKLQNELEAIKITNDTERLRIEKQAEIDRIKALTIKAGTRETIIHDGHIITAELDHAPIPGQLATSYHYAPRTEQTFAPPQTTIAAPLAPAQLTTGERDAINLIRAIPFNSSSILFGIRQSDGQPDILNLQGASHILTTGRSGQGKSTLCQLSTASTLVSNDNDHLKLACLDIEGLMSAPFKRYSMLYATEPAEILDALEELITTFEKRKLAAQRGELDIERLPDRWLIYVEEGLALPGYFENKEEKARCVAYLKRIALMYRKFGALLLFSTQASYADNTDTSIFRGQFNTRVTGAADRNQLRTVGFEKSPELDQLIRDARPGQFARQTAQGTILLDVPKLDMSRLPELLRHRETQRTTTRPKIEISRIDEVEEQTDEDTTDMIEETKNAPQSLDSIRAKKSLSIDERAVLHVYSDGITSTRTIAEKTGIGRTKVGEILNVLRAAGLIDVTGQGVRAVE